MVAKGGKRSLTKSWWEHMLFSASMGNLATDIKIINANALWPKVIFLRIYSIKIFIQGRNKIYTRLFVGTGCDSRRLETTQISSVRVWLHNFVRTLWGNIIQLQKWGISIKQSPLHMIKWKRSSACDTLWLANNRR